MDSYIDIIKMIDIQMELIIFMLIVAFLLYTRPNILVNFSRTFLGRLILLSMMVVGTLRSTSYGILIALLIIVFAEQIYTKEGFDSSSMVKINVSTFVSWNDANTLASNNGGRLPTKEEFQAAAINVGNIDMWMPATNGTETNFWVQVGTRYWPLHSTQPGVVNSPPTWGVNNTPAGYRPGPTGSSSINYIYIVKDTPPASASSCPSGYNGPNADGNCTKRWSNDCGESCAKTLCGNVGGKWIPLDYAHHPYTCNVIPPKPTCSLQDSNPANNDFVNFPYEYIEQPTDQNTDVVATDPNAQYLKIKTQTNVYGPGGTAQFRVHTPAYVPSEGDTVQITINEYTGVGKYAVPAAIINAGKWFNKDGEIPVLIYNTGGDSVNGELMLSLLILKGQK